MRRILFNFALVTAIVGFPLSLQASYKVVKLEQAGTLQSVIGNGAMELDSLRVEGPMNLSDVRVGWRCACL